MKTETSNAQHPTPNVEAKPAAIGCIRCTDGWTPLYCLNCANEMNREVRRHVTIGDIGIARLENGQLWLTYRGGEGMALSDDRELAAVLEKFFQQKF